MQDMSQLSQEQCASRRWMDAVTRLEQIDRVMQELEQCRADSSMGSAIGELDQLTELHRLLYEVTL